jgi:hypothetical protein
MMMKTKLTAICTLAILFLTVSSTVKANQIVDFMDYNDNQLPFPPGPHFFPGGPTLGWLIWKPEWGWTHTYSFEEPLPPSMITSAILEIKHFGNFMYYEHKIYLDDVYLGYLDNGFPYETSNITTFVIDPANFDNLLDGVANVWLDIDYPDSVAIWWSRLTINYVPSGLDHIEISGPSEVEEDSVTGYTCTAYFVVGGVTTSSDVTNSISWSDNSDFASFDSGGFLTTTSVSADQPCQIKATFGGKTDTHDITIKNVIPTVSITADVSLGGEPGSNGIFGVSRTGSTKETLRVYYNTVGSTASSGYDYMALPGYVDIPPGESAVAISVIVIDDDIEEGNEEVKVNLTTNPQYYIGQASATVTIGDDEGTPPASTGHIPAKDSYQVARDTIIQLHVTDDSSGIDKVTIHVEGDLIYDSDAENPVGIYDSTGSGQAVEGICRRIGSDLDYMYVFQGSTLFDYEQKVDVEVNATDKTGYSMTDTYSFYTRMRTFGKNIRVNTDTGKLAQNHPATAVDSNGNIWVVWEHTIIASDSDIYIGKLPEGGSAFESSTPVISNTNNQRNPAIAIDRNDNDKIYAVWQDNRNGNWDIFMSTYDGTNWSLEKMINEIEIDPTNPVSNQVNPAIVIDRQSPYTVYVVWQDDDNGNQDIYSANSSDGFSTNLLITNNDSDQTEPVIDITGSIPHIIWTDARDSDTDIYAAKGTIEESLVVTSSNQSSPSVAISQGDLHLLWVDDESGFDDIFYGKDGSNLPIDDGISIIDELRTEQGAPSIAVDETKVFACWEDSRWVSNNADIDIYYAEKTGSGFGTNILVNDDFTIYTQTSPVINTDKDGNPYMVWVDNREGNNDIYAVAATSLGQVLATGNIGASGGIVEDDSTPRSGIVDSEDDVIVEIPQGTLKVDTTITIRELNNPPELPPGAFGVYYEFSPSGLEFDLPVTITIPHAAADCPAHSEYKVYFYDPTLFGTPWSQDGITDVEHLTALQDPDLPSDVHVVRFKTTHFTAFGAGGPIPGAPSSSGGGGGGGGCSVSAGGEGNIVEFFLPYVGFIIVLVILTVRDARVRKAHNR